jgi:hypothetical protein
VAAIRNSFSANNSPRFIFSPAIDGDLVPESPRQLLLDGKFANIPFISSSTKDE